MFLVGPIQLHQRKGKRLTVGFRHGGKFLRGVAPVLILVVRFSQRIEQSLHLLLPLCERIVPFHLALVVISGFFLCIFAQSIFIVGFVLGMNAAHEQSAGLGFSFHILSCALDVRDESARAFLGLGGDGAGDHKERDHGGEHEDDGLEGVGPHGAANATEEHVCQDDTTNDQAAEPRRDSVGQPTGIEHRRSGRLDELACREDADEQIRDDQQY